MPSIPPAPGSSSSAHIVALLRAAGLTGSAAGARPSPAPTNPFVPQLNGEQQQLQQSYADNQLLFLLGQVQKAQSLQLSITQLQASTAVSPSPEIPDLTLQHIHIISDYCVFYIQIVYVSDVFFTLHYSEDTSLYPDTSVAAQSDTTSTSLESRVDNLEKMLLNGPPRPGRRRKVNTTQLPWYKRRNGVSPEEKAAWSQLLKKSRETLRFLLGITSATAPLPHPTAAPTLAGETPGFTADLTKDATDKSAVNAAWIARARELLEAEFKENTSSNAPTITRDAIVHALHTSFQYLKRQYKDQNEPMAMLKKLNDEHIGRWKSTQRTKFNQRSHAAARFEEIHGFDPSDLLATDYMSGDESAGEDQARERSYLAAVKLDAAKEHLPDLKVLAPQRLEWRTDAVSSVYDELDRIHRSLKTGTDGKKKGRLALLRVPREVGIGPLISTPPLVQPLPCMVDSAWREFAAAEFESVIDGWDGDPETDPDGLADALAAFISP
ncbi:hypothetical protein AURDEDRAFT_129059 [Auricularia subglabra TFB-10046 SS5]|uniref:Uncharacterized protein n=1 Tax=Auricularia subglabra (strain TFB-10046 / SS5) TaxID=717982 RepID=J0LID5_AURST|nr:hypothetical protein AURDEDRAFT_129059 [Auricularia subglabra TFB-10046 SS5]